MSDTPDDAAENDADEPTDAGDGASADDEEKSFRERVEEIRERRAEEGEEGGRPDPEEMMGGGGGPPGMGGGGGGGPPGMGGGRGGAEESDDNEELVREVRQLRDEVRDATRQLQRIAQAVEDLDD